MTRLEEIKRVVAETQREFSLISQLCPANKNTHAAHLSLADAEYLLDWIAKAGAVIEAVVGVNPFVVSELINTRGQDGDRAFRVTNVRCVFCGNDTTLGHSGDCAYKKAQQILKEYEETP